MSTITLRQVEQIARLANIPITEVQAGNLQSAFAETLAVIDNLKEVDIENVEPTHQVTGLENVMRVDTIDTDHSFSQEEALANAKATYQGYFVVPRILDND